MASFVFKKAVEQIMANSLLAHFSDTVEFEDWHSALGYALFFGHFTETRFVVRKVDGVWTVWPEEADLAVAIVTSD